MMDRRTFLAATGSLALTACATPPRGVYDTTEIPVPQWRVGDRWVYRRTDYYTKLPAGILTREVVSIGNEGVHITTRDDGGRQIDDALYSPPGIEVSGTLSEDGPVTGTLQPGLDMYGFPLVAGKTWQQSLTRTDSNGFRTPMTASIRAEGWETVRAAGKDYRALVIRRQLNLGPKDSFTGGLYRTEVEWLAPELRGAASLTIEEWYFEYRYQVLGPMRPGNRFIYELQSFQLA